ncbi:HAD family hydrolase [Chitinophaga horti]|uniref:HAD family hydrolase n=1 Tax=Chitinophaga horti TaxID=2920382 RepID=A0ABY6JBT4_9BACT|nr:HAD family hydrolase [Chitinophaga horti]UYQ95756.1 HAD family hydrolase [Chitinophaga horti]
MMLLATDLDGTFLGGSTVARQQLYMLLRKRRDIQLVYVTGRGLSSVEPLIAEEGIPTPAYIIGDVGATIVNGWTLQPVMPLQAPIAAVWPGCDVVRNQLRGIPGLLYQDVPQERRCSFYLKEASLLPTIREQLAGLNCDVIYSAGKYLDVLPAGVNKGTSLMALVDLLDVDPVTVLVAGDSLNDLAMYHCGYKGVVVGNCEQALAVATHALPDVICAQADGAGAILEAMGHFALPDRKPELVNC